MQPESMSSTLHFGFELLESKRGIFADKTRCGQFIFFPISKLLWMPSTFCFPMDFYCLYLSVENANIVTD